MSDTLISASRAGSLYGLLEERARASPDAVAFHESDTRGEWSALSWADVQARCDRIADALLAAGLVPGDRVAVLLPNCVDWVCFDMAAHRLGLLVVALYTHDSPENAAHMITDAGPKLILTDTAERWRPIRERLSEPDRVPSVWLRNGTAPGADALADVLAQDHPTAAAPEVAPSDTAALIYTSGTTGRPKGVMLSHAAILSNAEAVAHVFPPLPSDVFLSILPLAHAFERTMGYILPMMAGAAIAYGRGVATLRKDLAAVRPTVIMGVPRLYESMYDAALQKASSSPVKRRLFEMTTRIGWARFAAAGGLGPRPRLLDRLVWPLLDRQVARKVGAAFGGRLRVAVSGGADLPVDISRAMVGLGIPMVEGYGLSEVGPVVTATNGPEYRPGSVGFGLPGTTLRVAEDGELQVRSPSAMLGYWHQPDASAASFTEDGWLRTGDLARLEDGRVHIAGRLKQIFVLSNGENVNPRPMEVELEGLPLFDQVCVIGDKRPFVSVIASLNKDAWKAEAAALGLDDDGAEDPEALKHLLARVRDVLDGFPAFQKPRAIHATPEDWTVENGLLTPTLKVKRNEVLERYAAEIDALYAKKRGAS